MNAATNSRSSAGSALTQLVGRIRETFSRLNPRERNLIIIGAALIALTLLWLLSGWQAKTHRELDVSIPRARAQLARMQSESAELARLRNLPPRPAANLTQLAATLPGTATTRGLALTIRNDGNQLLVSGKGVSFDNWTQWLAETQRDNAIRMTYLDVRQAGDGLALEARLTPL